jgi:hypothetical protein
LGSLAKIAMYMESLIWDVLALGVAAILKYQANGNTFSQTHAKLAIPSMASSDIKALDARHTTVTETIAWLQLSAGTQVAYTDHTMMLAAPKTKGQSVPNAVGEGDVA